MAGLDMRPCQLCSLDYITVRPHAKTRTAGMKVDDDSQILNFVYY